MMQAVWAGAVVLLEVVKTNKKILLIGFDAVYMGAFQIPPALSATKAVYTKIENGLCGGVYNRYLIQ
jgi:hypothetical protein